MTEEISQAFSLESSHERHPDSFFSPMVAKVDEGRKPEWRPVTEHMSIARALFCRLLDRTAGSNTGISDRGL